MKRIILLAAACAVAIPAYAQNAPASGKPATQKSAATAGKPATPKPLSPNAVVATVNGRPITQKSVDDFVNAVVSQGNASDSPQLREQVKEELINRQIMVQAAEKLGIEKQPAVRAEVDLARQSILVRALMADYLNKHPVTDAQVQAQYDKLKQQESGKLEYKVRHILVKDEKTANDLLAQIKADRTKFDDLAKKNSQDPGSAANGGDLGWAPATNYVPPFADAVTKLKKGELADKPVQTQYGWHIIAVDDTRPVEFPPVDQVKPQIEDMLRQQLLGDYQKTLRSEAKVQ